MRLIYQTDQDTLFQDNNFPDKIPWSNIQVYTIHDELFDVIHVQEFKDQKINMQLIGRFDKGYEAINFAREFVGLPCLDLNKDYANDNLFTPNSTKTF